MTRHSPELRQALGRALRALREQGQLSLDDVERSTREAGVRVTRSHLSRVENGQADLALPRFLGLMRAMGEPPAAIIERLDALLSDPRGTVESRLHAASRAAKAGDPVRAAREWRAAFSMPGTSFDAATWREWIFAEASSGHWRAAARIAHHALGEAHAPDPRALLRAAAALAGARLHVPAAAFARASVPHFSREARLVEAVALLAGDRLDEAATAIDSETAHPRDEANGIALSIKAEILLALGQANSAHRTALRACEFVRTPAARVEAKVTLARTLTAIRRPAAGLRALGEASVEARGQALLDIVARCHLEAERLRRLDADAEGARTAARAHRALVRRLGAEPEEPAAGPIHALLRISEP